MVLAYSVQANAALHNLGTDSLGNQLIYDTDFDITWYDYSNYGNWQSMMNWADGLTVDFGGTIIDDWRLPTALNQDGSGPCSGNCTDSEMGHLYYTELGNVGYPTTGYGLSNTGDFQNLQATNYFSGTEYSADPRVAWLFNIGSGRQTSHRKGVSLYAIAVRPGDVSVAVAPEPVSMILFGVGGVVMVARRKLMRRRG